MFQEIKTKKVPSPLGPYVQGALFSNVMFISGQIGLNEKSNFSKKNISEETMTILNNIKNILRKGKFNINDVVKTTLYVIDINDLEKINIIYKDFFLKNNSQFPSRSCVQVANLPYGANIEIEAFAMKNVKI